MAYITRPRTLLLSFLSAHPHTHITMEEILDFARQNSIGTATVYRYIDTLLKEGRLCRYMDHSRQNAPCFQWHEADCALYHFVCTTCGKCFHISCPELQAVDAHILKEHDFRVNLPATVFQGKCAACDRQEVAR